MNKTIIVVGGQWGDEGKGKIVDYLTEQADMVVRYNGGNNAGHTVVADGVKYALHLIPSGIIHKTKLNVVGNGTVIDPVVMVKEFEKLEGQGLTISPENLIISSSAHVITKEQIEQDKASAASKKIGTTGRGIGPCYRDKALRIGMRMGKYVETDTAAAKKLKPYIKDTYKIINTAIEEGKKVLFEGAQGTLLDIDHGTYPFVTSSNPTAGGTLTGSGVGPTKIDSVIAISKAYITRVGGGPFATELGTEEETKDEGTWEKIKDNYDKALKESMEKANEGDEYHQGRLMRLQGREYGTTTGRPRRTGWFDVVAAKYTIAINGLTSMVITKLDVLQNLKEIKLCTAYEIDGKVVEDFPLDSDDLAKAKPVYLTMPGFEEDITKAKTFEDLPENAKKYIKKLEELIGCPISIVSVGPGREQTIILNKESLF